MAFLFVFCTSDLGGGIAASATFFGSFIWDFEIPDVEHVCPDIMNGEKKIMVEAESINSIALHLSTTPLIPQLFKNMTPFQGFKELLAAAAATLKSIRTKSHWLHRFCHHVFPVIPGFEECALSMVLQRVP